MWFLLTLLIVGAIVSRVLHFSGFDLGARLGRHAVNAASRSVGSDFFTTNVIAGIVSGVIVAVLQWHGSPAAKRLSRGDR